MNSFKDGLRRSGQSVLDARAQNLYEMTKIEEEQFNSIQMSYYDKLIV